MAITRSDVTITLTNPSWLVGEVYIQGMTTLNITVDERIKRPEIRYFSDGVLESISKSNYVEYLVKKSEDTAHEIWVYDGYGNSEVFPIPTLKYNPPTVEIRTERLDGNRVRVYATGSVTSLENRNSKKLIIRGREVTSTFWQSFIPTIGWDFDVYRDFSEIYENHSYEFEAVLSDNVQTVTAKGADGIICISELAGGKGVRLFKEAENEGFWVNNENYDLDTYRHFPSAPHKLVDVLNEFHTDVGLHNDVLFGTGSQDPLDPYNEGLVSRANSMSNRITSLEDKALSKNVIDISKGNLTIVPALKMAFVRIYHKNTQKWTKGSKHTLETLSYKPAYSTALACHCNVEMSAFIDDAGNVSAVPKVDMNSGFAIYISGIFMY